MDWDKANVGLGQEVFKAVQTAGDASFSIPGWVIVVIVLVSNYLLQQSVVCTTIDQLETSLEVKRGVSNLVGLNADTDNLNFGKVSPVSTVERSVKVNYSEDATVKVVIESEFSNWVTIKPRAFKISADEEKEVFLSVNVPGSAEEGTYSGRVKFCFQE